MLSSFSSRFSFGASSPVGGGGITPDQLPNLLAWYKADALQGYSNGDPVTSWIDSSENGINLSEGIDNRAIYIASDPNFGGKPSVKPIDSFSGISFRRITSGQFPVGNESFAMYAVVRSESSDSSHFKGRSFGFGDANQYGIRSCAMFTFASYVASGAGGYYVQMNWDPPYGAGGNISASNNTTYILQYSYGGGDIFTYPFYQNDTAHSTGSGGGTLNISAESKEVRIGGQPGAFPFPTNQNFHGSVAEVIMYKDYHDETIISQIRAYLNSKYSVY